MSHLVRCRCGRYTTYGLACTSCQNVMASSCDETTLEDAGLIEERPSSIPDDEYDTEDVDGVFLEYLDDPQDEGLDTER